MLIEARRQPRSKLCAGGLPPKVIGALPASTRDLIEVRASEIRFTFAGGYAYTLGFQRPAVHLVDRGRLDQRLSERAVALGTELREGVRVRGLRSRPGKAELVTDQGRLMARIVIAADGAGGVGARLLGRGGVRACPAAQSEVRVSDRELSRWQAAIGCDFGVVAGGIGWVFPKADHLSIGVCSFRPPGSLRAAFERLLATLGIRPVMTPRLRRHPLPTWDGRRIFSSGRVLVAGDAAGLVNPLTGAGIRRACISGDLAAQSATAFLASGARDERDLRSYERRIREDLIEELSRARILARLFFRTPALFYHSGVANLRVNPWIEELLSGQKGYVEVFGDILRAKWLRARRPEGSRLEGGRLAGWKVADTCHRYLP